jgi:hypothetical protein
MRVLIDSSLPDQFRALLPLSGVRTAKELGWQDKTPEELLVVAATVFDVVITLRETAEVPDALAVIVVRTDSNQFGALMLCVPPLLGALAKVQPGLIQIVTAAG